MTPRVQEDNPAIFGSYVSHRRVAPANRIVLSQADGAYQAWRSEELARIEARYLENGLLIQLCQRFSACSGE
jgi:hypothetical protein